LSSTTDKSPERGQVLVLFAGGLITLLIIAALAFDVGMMLVERRDQQNAADAAALAGARFVLSDPAKAEPAARQLAMDNGFIDADPDEIVNVFIPAIHGRYAGLPGFIEVQIEATRPSVFGGIIGKAAWPVGVFAVATNAQKLEFPFSMLALDPTACKAIQVSGQGDVNAVGTIQSNSSGEDCPGDPISFSRTGGSEINVGVDIYCRASGPIQDEGSGDMDCTPAANSFALPDPLRDLPDPAKPILADPILPFGHSLSTPNGCPGSSAPATELAPAVCNPGGGTPSNDYRGKAWIMFPGLYPGGINVTNDATVYLMPGIYWIGGGGLGVQTGASIVTIGTNIDGTPNVAGGWSGGVLIFNSQLPAAAGGDITLNSSSATMNLKPFSVTAGDPLDIYNNIVIFQDRALSNTVTLNGSDSGAIVEGLIYVPNGEVVLNGNNGTLTVGQIIAGTFKINGDHGTINVTDDDLFKAEIVAAGLVD
jgi:hypothetical protein